MPRMMRVIAALDKSLQKCFSCNHYFYPTFSGPEAVTCCSESFLEEIRDEKNRGLIKRCRAESLQWTDNTHP